MSGTPKNADACLKLLDNGWTIMLRKNSLGSYTALAIGAGQDPDDACELEQQITDDFLPSQALYRMSEKMIGNVA